MTLLKYADVALEDDGASRVVDLVVDLPLLGMSGGISGPAQTKLK